MLKWIMSKIKTKPIDYKVTESDSPYFVNIECLKCHHTERVPFNVVGYKCDRCTNNIFDAIKSLF